MKSKFSRFLHHTLSLSDVNPQSTDISSYSGLTRISRWKKFANLFDLDTPIKSECDTMRTDVSLKFENDSVCTGRSMVEMLGVLAIIGVLSVGAIAGYSKAMMKYKLNQHAEAVNMLINNVLSIKDRLQHNEEGETYYGTLLYKMNLLPDGIKYISNTFVRDSWFNSNMWVYSYKMGTGGIGFQFDSASSVGAEVCRNIVITAKENAANLRLINLQKIDLNDNVEYTGGLYGDAYCSSEKNCLRNLDLNKISTLCNSCDEKSCRIYINWK